VEPSSESASDPEDFSEPGTPGHASELTELRSLLAYQATLLLTEREKNMVLDAELARVAGEAERQRDQLALALERSEAAELERDALRAGAGAAEASLAQFAERDAKQRAELARLEAVAQETAESSRYQPDAASLELTEAQLELQRLRACAKQDELELSRLSQLEASYHQLEHSFEAARRENAQSLALLAELRERNAALVLEKQTRDSVAIALANEASALRRHLANLTCLSARALDRLAGVASHLAIEVAIAQGPEIASAMRGWELEDDAEQLRDDIGRHVEQLGLARSFRVEGDGGALRGRLSIPEGVALTDSEPFARWVAAYAIGCFREHGRDHYLATLTGGPRDYDWTAVPRLASESAHPAVATDPT
jgi:hypothetical protein